MSTEHYLLCTDCNEAKGNANGGGYMLADVWDRRHNILMVTKMLADVRAMEEKLGGNVQLTCEMTIGWGSNPIDLEFIEKHNTHHVVVEDACGCRDGECCDWFYIPGDKQIKWCRAPKGHPPGEHRAER